MSDEGQKLISESGYFNLNEKLDRNKNVEPPYDWSIESGLADIGFYNEITGEFYGTDESGSLLVYDNFPDYVLHDSKYKDNAKVREYLTLIFNSDIEKRPFTARLQEDNGTIYLQPWMDGVLDNDDFFRFIYDDIYYANLTYYIDEDKYVLEALD